MIKRFLNIHIHLPVLGKIKIGKLFIMLIACIIVLLLFRKKKVFECSLRINCDRVSFQIEKSRYFLANGRLHRISIQGFSSVEIPGTRASIYNSSSEQADTFLDLSQGIVWLLPDPEIGSGQILLENTLLNSIEGIDHSQVIIEMQSFNNFNMDFIPEDSMLIDLDYADTLQVELSNTNLKADEASFSDQNFNVSIYSNNPQKCILKTEPSALLSLNLVLEKEMIPLSFESSMYASQFQFLELESTALSSINTAEISIIGGPKSYKFPARNKLILETTQPIEITSMKIEKDAIHLDLFGQFRKVAINTPENSLNPRIYLWMWETKKYQLLGIFTLLVIFLAIIPDNDFKKAVLNIVSGLFRMR